MPAKSAFVPLALVAALVMSPANAPVMFDGLGTSGPQISAGRIRGLAVTATKRVPALPDVPTSAEAGLPGFELSTWYGVFAPAGNAVGDGRADDMGDQDRVANSSNQGDLGKERLRRPRGERRRIQPARQLRSSAVA